MEKRNKNKKRLRFNRSCIYDKHLKSSCLYPGGELTFLSHNMRLKLG